VKKLFKDRGGLIAVFFLALLVARCATGGSAKTSETPSAASQRSAFSGMLAKQLKESFVPPAKFLKSDLTTQVALKLDSFGNIRQLDVKKSSGNQEFDRVVVSSLHARQPLPKPPEGVLGEEIVLEMRAN
jgi:TonB family protein